VTFLFTDNQIANEGFVEDINNVLNTGEVPGLFPADERDRIMDELRPYVIEHGITETRDAMYDAFIDRVRDNLHLVLAMSPVGEAFRTRCRQFPSLINCCTIDWYNDWPEAALLSVSSRFLHEVDVGGATDKASEEVKAQLATMCVQMHTTVTLESERYFQELRRRFYTTPKSYLDLINLYTALLSEKREEFSVARDRLLNGLTKLEETNVVIDKMKIDLGELQPILEEKSKVRFNSPFVAAYAREPTQDPAFTQPRSSVSNNAPRSIR
jgi:dynein heavy chain